MATTEDSPETEKEPKKQPQKGTAKEEPTVVETDAHETIWFSGPQARRQKMKDHRRVDARWVALLYNNAATAGSLMVSYKQGGQDYAPLFGRDIFIADGETAKDASARIGDSIWKEVVKHVRRNGTCDWLLSLFKKQGGKPGGKILASSGVQCDLDHLDGGGMGPMDTEETPMTAVARANILSQLLFQIAEDSAAKLDYTRALEKTNLKLLEAGPAAIHAAADLCRAGMEVGKDNHEYQKMITLQLLRGESAKMKHMFDIARVKEFGTLGNRAIDMATGEFGTALLDIFTPDGKPKSPQTLVEACQRLRRTFTIGLMDDLGMKLVGDIAELLVLAERQPTEKESCSYIMQAFALVDDVKDKFNPTAEQTVIIQFMRSRVMSYQDKKPAASEGKSDDSSDSSSDSSDSSDDDEPAGTITVDAEPSEEESP